MDTSFSGFVKSDYKENIPEGLFSTAGCDDYDIGFEVMECWCKQNYDLVIGGSFGFLHQQAAVLDTDVW